MGPRVGRTTPYQLSETPTIIGDIPPSSIAVQFAGRLANGHQAPKTQDRESFRLLLEEILDGSDHVWQAEESTSSDATVNSRLICVILQAGFGSNSSRQAGELSQEEREDIIRSLQAINLILSRSPDALFQPLELDLALGFPLFAWLLPKVLVETRDCEFDEIEQQVRDTINLSLSTTERAKSRHRRIPQVATYVRGLIAGTYSTLTPHFSKGLSDRILDLFLWIETSNIRRDELDGSHHPPIPSLGTAGEAFQGVYENPDDLSAIQVIPRSSSHLFMIVLVLLAASVLSVDKPQRRLMCDHHVAALESVLCDLRRVWTALTARGCFGGGISAACLRALVSCLRRVLMSLSKLVGSSSSFSRASIFLSEVLIVALANKPAASGSSLESEICLALSDLPVLVQESTSISKSVSEHLLPRLCDAALLKERSPTFLKALQASTS